MNAADGISGLRLWQSIRWEPPGTLQSTATLFLQLCCCNLLQLYCCSWQTLAYAATPHQGRAVESHHAKSKPSRREPSGASCRLSSSKKISQARKTCKNHLRWSDGPAAASIHQRVSHSRFSAHPCSALQLANTRRASASVRRPRQSQRFD